MTLAKISRRGQVTIPVPIRERLALMEGDYLEMTVEDGRIVLTPTEVIDRHPAIDAAIAEGLADAAAGRVTPAFESVEELVAYLQAHPFDGARG